MMSAFLEVTVFPPHSFRQAATRTLLANGFATPMRGKSWTCRSDNPFFLLRVSDPIHEINSGQRPHQSEELSRQVLDLPRIGVAKPLRQTRDFDMDAVSDGLLRQIGKGV